MFNKLKKTLTGWWKKEETEEESVKKSEKKTQKKKEKKAEKKIDKKAKVRSEKTEKLKKKIESKIEEKVELEKPELDRKIDSKIEVSEKKLEIKEKSVEEEKSAEPAKQSFGQKVSSLFKRKSEEKNGEVESVPEPIEEPIKDSVVEEVKEESNFFSKLAHKITAASLSEDDFNSFFEEFEFSLLENNVALEVVDAIREKLRDELVGKQFTQREAGEKILEALKGAIEGVLIEGDDLVAQIRASGKSPFVILFFGINGAGKTTSIAKVAHKLKSEGLRVVLAAGDTFRAASIEQLQTHGERLGVPVIAQQYQSDPAAVAFDAISYAKKHSIDVVLIDTAGRMYTASNLMREMEKIVRVAQPDLKLFVGESITGNDATEQARMFHQTAGIDGIVLSKADVDEKAGTILSVGFVTGKPIYYLGVGQEYGDLERFTKKRVLENLGLE